MTLPPHLLTIKTTGSAVYDNKTLYIEIVIVAMPNVPIASHHKETRDNECSVTKCLLAFSAHLPTSESSLVGLTAYQPT